MLKRLRVVQCLLINFAFPGLYGPGGLGMRVRKYCLSASRTSSEGPPSTCSRLPQGAQMATLTVGTDVHLGNVGSDQMDLQSQGAVDTCLKGCRVMAVPMGSFEENYSEDVLRTFTEEERAQLRKLHQQLDDKFDEIVSLLAEQLGYSTTDPRCYEEAENVIDRWEEDAEIAADPIEPTNALQGLLRQHHDIAEEILGIRDLAFQRNQEGPVREEVIELMRTREVIFAVWRDPNMPFGQRP